jgi:hypothetical protein
MAIYHLSTNIISRSKGHSAVAAAAYRAGARLVQKVVDQSTGLVNDKVHNYENKDGVVFSSILVPEEHEDAQWLKDRQQLWGKVEEIEVRKDAQLARQIILALPLELSQEENIELVQKYVKDVLVKAGMVVDLAVHYDNPANPHAHLLMTMRSLERDEDDEVVFGNKNRDWNQKYNLMEWREGFARLANKELELRGFDERISHLSYEERGIELEATKHEGKARHSGKGFVSGLNAEKVRQNIAAIVKNPELVIDALRANKPVFTREDIKGKLEKVLMQGLSSEERQVFASNKSALELDVLKALEEVIGSDKLVRIAEKNFKGEAVYASKSQLELEQKFIESVESLSKSYSHTIEIGGLEVGDLSKELSCGIKLSAKQFEVVKDVLGGSDLAIVQGLPGAGKSSIMKVIQDVYRNAGYRVIGTSVSAAACSNLREIIDAEIRTVAGWKSRWNWMVSQGKDVDLGAKDILVIDEMSMVEIRDMKYLLEMAASKGSKVVMIGDVNQFSAIADKGAAIAAMKRADYLELDEIRRMKVESHRSASMLIASKDIRGAVTTWAESGLFDLSSSKEVAREKLVLDYANHHLDVLANSGNADDKAGRGEENFSSVILSHSNREVKRLNNLVRDKLKLAGVLAESEVDIKLGRKRLKLSIGDKVLFGKNDKGLGVINGDIGVVKEVTADVLKVAVKGKIIKIDTANYKELSHGYALTIYKAQGSTYRDVFVMDERAIWYESFNVAMSRHKRSVKVYFSGEELGIESSFEADKKLELIQKLVDRLSRNSSVGLATDYDFESLEAKNIEHYLKCKNEVISEVGLISKWKRGYLLEHGYEPKISDYENINSFIEAASGRRAVAC